MTVYCANRDGLFGHFCVYHNTVVSCLHVCSFCVFCVGFIFYLLCCWCLCKPYKMHWKYEITSLRYLLGMLVCSPPKKPKPINNKIMIISKNEVYQCGVQNMIGKRLLEIETVQISQSSTKMLSVLFWNTQHLP